MANYLLTSPPPVRLKPSAVLACLVQSILVFSVSRTAGVTHWKLQDNAITPAATDLSEASTEDLFAMSLASTDPEFAVLLRHATKDPPGSMGNRGQLRRGSPRACPVVSISMDGSAHATGGCKQECTGSSSRDDKSTMMSSDASGSCGRPSQCGCRGNGAGTCNDKTCGNGDGALVGGAGGGDTGGGGGTPVVAKQPRNPDGSGPM